MSETLLRNKLLRPELFLSELIKKYAQDGFVKSDEYPEFLRRAVVVAIDVEGGHLQNPSGTGSVTHVVSGKRIEVTALKGPHNPPNSIKARVISESEDQFSDDAGLAVFWPLLPEHLLPPLKINEHCYVTSEDAQGEHGLWIGKVSGHDNVNFYDGVTSYERDDRPLTTAFGLGSKDESPSEDEMKERVGETSRPSQAFSQ